MNTMMGVALKVGYHMSLQFGACLVKLISVKLHVEEIVLFS